MTPEKSAATLGAPAMEPLPVAKKLRLTAATLGSRATVPLPAVKKLPLDETNDRTPLTGTQEEAEGAVKVIVDVSDPCTFMVNTPGIPTKVALLPGSKATCTVEG